MREDARTPYVALAFIGHEKTRLRRDPSEPPQWRFVINANVGIVVLREGRLDRLLDESYAGPTTVNGFESKPGLNTKGD
jgi:hypothetical protein